MDRVTMTDGSGCWFDRGAATRYDECTRWDGNNHVPVGTGPRWNHAALYRTAGGKWILHTWSQMEAIASQWLTLSDGAAAEWLASNRHYNVVEAAEGIAALQIA
jgi:hypothetical protein